MQHVPISRARYVQENLGILNAARGKAQEVFVALRVHSHSGNDVVLGHDCWHQRRFDPGADF